MPSPPPSPTLSKTTSRAEHKPWSKMSKVTNSGCIAEEPIPTLVFKTEDDDSTVLTANSDSPSPAPCLDSDSETLCDPPEIDKPVQTDTPRTPRTRFSGTLLTPQSQPPIVDDPTPCTPVEPSRYKLLPPDFDSLPPKVKTSQSPFVIKTSETEVVFLNPTALSLGHVPEKVNATKPDVAVLENIDVSNRNRTFFSQILGMIYGW